jgi:rhamnulose-1-phosphate aldolase
MKNYDRAISRSSLSSAYDEISRVAGFLWNKGWAEKNAGNISVDITEVLAQINFEKSDRSFFKLEKSYPSLNERRFLITIAGSRKRDISNAPIENTLIIEVSDNPCGYYILESGAAEPGFPTSELFSHLAIHDFLKRRKPLYNAVLHTHPTELIALSHIAEFLDEAALNNILWGMIPEVIISVPDGIGLVPYELPGSSALANATVKSLEKRDAILWEKHGALAIGKSLEDAFDSIDVLNKAAEVFLVCVSAGNTPVGLGEKKLLELMKVFHKRDKLF